MSSVVPDSPVVMGRMHQFVHFSIRLSVVRLEDKLPIQNSNRPLVLSNDVQLFMWNVRRLLLSILFRAFAASSATIALIITHYRH